MNPYASPASSPGGGGTGTGGTARLQGDALVVSRDASLPSVCIKCGSHDGITRRDAKFQWTPMWARMLVLVCTPGALIAILVTTKRANLSVPLCVPCNQRWGQAATLLIVAILALVSPLALLMLSHDDPSLALGGFGLGFVFFLVVMLAVVKPRMLQVNLIDDREIHLKGFHPEAAREITAALGG
jgi:hypothetical protein